MIHIAYRHIRMACKLFYIPCKHICNACRQFTYWPFLHALKTYAHTYQRIYRAEFILSVACISNSSSATRQL